MTAQQIIDKFELKVDDTTELSSVEELALLNKVYQFICDDRPWEFLKKEATGTIATTLTITLPADFGFFVENLNYTDNSFSTQVNAKPVGIMLTSNGVKKWLRIVNWSDRRQYADQDGFAYVDIAAGVIRFTYAQNSGSTYSFDYKANATDLALGDTPIFPSRFHEMIASGMAIDDMAMQLFDKARSYANEYRAEYRGYYERMAMYNANLQNY